MANTSPTSHRWEVIGVAAFIVVTGTLLWCMTQQTTLSGFYWVLLAFTIGMAAFALHAGGRLLGCHTPGGLAIAWMAQTLLLITMIWSWHYANLTRMALGSAGDHSLHIPAGFYGVSALTVIVYIGCLWQWYRQRQLCLELLELLKHSRNDQHGDHERNRSQD